MAENQRLKEVIDYLIEVRKIRNQEEFSQITGIIKSTISQLCTGKRELNERYVRKICKLFPEVSADYLLEGSGPMVIGSVTQNNNNGDNIAGSNITVNKAPAGPAPAGDPEYNERRELLGLLKEKDAQMNRLITIIEKLSNGEN